jgi:hypothetical protein
MIQCELWRNSDDKTFYFLFIGRKYILRIEVICCTKEKISLCSYFSERGYDVCHTTILFFTVARQHNGNETQ